ncbi:MAG: hypothetical protein HY896_11295 [Deltaproteobacteria bacterium]|nr:hypothetical protein [Deltaproteobacteria bacterium]
MASVRTGSLSFPKIGMTVIPALLLLFFLTAFLPPALETAQAQENDTVLEGSGIHYPGGFDPNTVGEVRGKAYGISVPERGPVRFRLETGRETYTVLASPKWFWKDQIAELPDGAEIRVRGSKTLGRDANLYIIAQRIRIGSSGRPVDLRTGDGSPLWRGPKAGGMGAPGGFGSPMRGGGGMGSGPGGMGGMGGQHR